MTASTPAVSDVLEKMPTGINGLDLICCGGLPKARTTLLCGTSGSAKTVLAAQFLAEGIKRCGDGGVFVTFEETPDDIRANMHDLGMPIREWEAQGKWAFVDASKRPQEAAVRAGSFDLAGLMARIEFAAKKVGAVRVALDSIGAVFSQVDADSTVRNELFRLAWSLRQTGVTSIMTAERTNDYGDISRFGVEEFVADNVVILRNGLDQEKRRRTIEILKMRGAAHQKGEFPFTIVAGEGIVIIPVAAIELKQRSSDIRVSSGNAALDGMCGGGFFRDSIILSSGATGTGKTLLVTQFLGAGASKKERSLIFAFEESREQLFRNAAGWGVNFEQLEKSGYLKVVCEYPESSGLEDHLVRIRDIIEEFKPQRIAVDSLSALERVANERSFREFVITLTSQLKHAEITSLFTATTATLLGGASITEAHISTITDTILLLRYVEIFGQMRRGLTVLKMRGSMHDKDIREFTIDARGMHIERPFRSVSGIIAGMPRHVPQSETERFDEMFLD